MFLTSNGTSLSEALEQELTISLVALSLNLTTRIRILNSRFALEHRYKEEDDNNKSTDSYKEEDDSNKTKGEEKGNTSQEKTQV